MQKKYVCSVCFRENLYFLLLCSNQHISNISENSQHQKKENKMRNRANRYLEMFSEAERLVLEVVVVTIAFSFVMGILAQIVMRRLL